MKNHVNEYGMNIENVHTFVEYTSVHLHLCRISYVHAVWNQSLVLDHVISMANTPDHNLQRRSFPIHLQNPISFLPKINAICPHKQ